MSVQKTIRKIVSEHIEKKQVILEEKNLIKKRFIFSLNGVNKNRKRVVESILMEEKRNLIRTGYDRESVNESFLDIMKTLYGSDTTKVITDIKKRLGERIASQVKTKQQEHEMILSAFESIPEETIEKAVKENRVDELSSLITNRAMEMFKTQLGSEGISGIMLSSIDENKFKTEVGKLIQPVIQDITTKMDEKLKQVQDVVSGSGLNPAA